MLAHGITNTITIDEDVVRQGAVVEATIGLESAAEIVLKDVGRDDLLTLLSLRCSLSVVLAHVLIVGRNKTYDALLALVANINTNEHGLVGDFLTKVHAPQVTTELGVDLSDNVQIDTVIVSVDRLAGDELRDNGVVRVNFIFNGGVEMLLSQGVRNDDEEELDDWSLRLARGCLLLVLNVDVVPEVGVNGILEVFNLGSVV